MSKLPKHHHYLPQFYLKGFSLDKNKLCVFDKKSTDSSAQYRNQSIEKIAYENNLYTYETKSGTKETLEDFFSQIEGQSKNIIDKLENKQEITPIERGYLSLFVSLLWLRTPSSKTNSLGAQEELAEKSMRMYYSFPQQKEMMKRFFKNQGKAMADEEIDDLIDFAKNPKRSKFTIDFPTGYWIKQMLTLADKIYTFLAHCVWEIRHSNKNYAFITSDSPVLLIPSEKPHPFYGYGLITTGVKKVVPLSSKICLVMHDPEKDLKIIHTIADKDFFRQINEWVTKNSERFVFSATKGKIEKMIKTKPELAKPRGKTYRVG